MLQRNVVLMALVVLAAVIVLIFGRNLLSNLGPAVQEAANATAEAENAGADNADLGVDQAVAQEIAPLVDQLTAWYEGPIAERTVALEEKMESGALSQITYGNFLLLYLNAHASGKNDMAMDWIASETVGPRLQPIYEAIASQSADISASLSAATLPDSLAETQSRLLQCLQYENQRSQAIVDVLTGAGSVEVPERAADPCASVEEDLAAMRDIVAANK
ncbi:MAG: hypothetical protein KDD84_16555 [Caldilineaceae bacterium]|nr:hypothetical protein [Caldilineaceae bacterium]